MTFCIPIFIPVSFFKRLDFMKINDNIKKLENCMMITFKIIMFFNLKDKPNMIEFHKNDDITF